MDNKQYLNVGTSFDTEGKIMYMALYSSNNDLFPHKKGDLVFVVQKSESEIILSTRGKDIVTVNLVGNDTFDTEYAYVGVCPININEL